jgi:hypothetical protein
MTFTDGPVAVPPGVDTLMVPPAPGGATTSSWLGLATVTGARSDPTFTTSSLGTPEKPWPLMVIVFPDATERGRADVMLGGSEDGDLVVPLLAAVGVVGVIERRLPSAS